MGPPTLPSARFLFCFLTGQQGTWGPVLFRLSAGTAAVSGTNLAQTDVEADTQTSAAELHRFEKSMSSQTNKVNSQMYGAHCAACCMQ